MKWNEIDQQTCSIARTLAVIGDRWSLMVLRDVFLGTRRFEDFCRQLGISRPSLTKCLRKLEEHGVLTKRQYQDRPPRFEYHLTEKGMDLYGVMMTMAGWGDRWQDAGEGAPIDYVHRSCGHKTRPTMYCSECHEPLRPGDVTPVIGPGLIAAAGGQQIPQEKLPPFLRRTIPRLQG